jgi:hypothetical protein
MKHTLVLECLETHSSDAIPFFKAPFHPGKAHLTLPIPFHLLAEHAISVDWGDANVTSKLHFLHG